VEFEENSSVARIFCRSLILLACLFSFIGCIGSGGEDPETTVVVKEVGLVSQENATLDINAQEAEEKRDPGDKVIEGLPAQEDLPSEPVAKSKSSVSIFKVLDEQSFEIKQFRNITKVKFPHGLLKKHGFYWALQLSKSKTGAIGFSGVLEFSASGKMGGDKAESLVYKSYTTGSMDQEGLTLDIGPWCCHEIGRFVRLFVQKESGVFREEPYFSLPSDVSENESLVIDVLRDLFSHVNGKRLVELVEGFQEWPDNQSYGLILQARVAPYENDGSSEILPVAEDPEHTGVQEFEKQITLSQKQETTLQNELEASEGILKLLRDPLVGLFDRFVKRRAALMQEMKRLKTDRLLLEFCKSQEKKQLAFQEFIVKYAQNEASLVQQYKTVDDRFKAIEKKHGDDEVSPREAAKLRAQQDEDVKKSIRTFEEAAKLRAQQYEDVTKSIKNFEEEIKSFKTGNVGYKEYNDLLEAHERLKKCFKMFVHEALHGADPLFQKAVSDTKEHKKNIDRNRLRVAKEVNELK
jgi:hypothetical protein